MNNTYEQLFDDFCNSLTQIEAKYSPVRVGNSGVDAQEGRRPFSVVGTQSENDQTGDESGKIADLNDRFRQNQSTEDDEIKGEWIMGDDITALPGPTKAAIKKKIGEHTDFLDWPLRDRGVFTHTTKGKALHVAWMIKVYDDPSLKSESQTPGDPSRSYRVMLVTLSDEEEAKS